MLQSLLAILGVFLIVGVTYLMSKHKKEIHWKTIGLLFITQFVLAFILLKTPVWKLVEWIANGIQAIISYSQEGIAFVFGGLATDSGWVLFFGGLLPIVFISALVGILFHFGILQKFVNLVGLSLAKVFNIDSLVFTNGVLNMFMGQSDSLAVTQSYLPKANDRVIFATLVSGMASMSIAVAGLYASMGASLEFIVISLPLTVISTFVLTQIVMPTKYVPSEELEISTDDIEDNWMSTMMNFATKGFEVVIAVVIALIVFLSLVAMVNGFIGTVFPSLTLQKIIGVIFLPIALLMGVPMAELGMVSELLASRLVFNEAVAYGMPQFSMLAENTKAMVTIALAGFGGIGSVSILYGTLKAFAPTKAKVVAKYGVLALIIANLVNIMSGAIVGLFL